MSSYLKAGKRKSIRKQSEKVAETIGNTLLHMNEVYYKLLGTENVTREMVIEASSYNFEDAHIDMIVNDLNKYDKDKS